MTARLHFGNALRPAAGVLLVVAVVQGCTAAGPAGLARWVEPTTGMAFVQVPAGSFMMGQLTADSGGGSGSAVRAPAIAEPERPHPVTIARPFWLGAYEVTQREWQLVMLENPSWFEGAARPVETVTWNEVQEFLTRLRARTPGSLFRLPTEAEWEYACRAGSAAPYATGDRLTTNDANIAVSTSRTAAGEGSTRAVGTYAPNAWGLHDMHGNVWEWTADQYCPYPEGAVTDPRPSCGSAVKVIRGGSWYFEADSAACSTRYTHRPGDRGFSLGFRVVREDSQAATN